MRTININNIKCNLGQKKLGVELGGNYLVKLLKPQTNFNITKFDINTYYSYSKPYCHIKNSNNFCINLGGDHSIGAVTIQPQLDKFRDDLLVIWIDAHADINTYETSKSKNTHGMPVAPLIGLMKHWWNSPYAHHKLKPSNLLYVGIRDLDLCEVDIIKQLKIKNFTTYSTLIDKWIQTHPAGKIHISLDIDGIDPVKMPSTGTTAKNGLTVEDVNQIINISRNRLISFDLVEFNPLIGTDMDLITTLYNCKKILDNVVAI